jgi:hypothetical protein
MWHSMCEIWAPSSPQPPPRAPKCLGADFATPIVVWGLLLPNIETHRTLLGGTQNEISHTGGSGAEGSTAKFVVECY